MVPMLLIKEKEKVPYFSQKEFDFRAGSRTTEYAAMGSGTDQTVQNRREILT